MRDLRRLPPLHLLLLLLLLLLCSLQAAVAPPCRQGATFPGMVVSLEVGSGSVVRLPGVASLARCVAAGCDLPGYDLVWLSRGSCYVLSCQQGEDCRPRPAHSTLAFLQRAPPQALQPSPQSERPRLDTPTLDGLVGGGGAKGRSQKEEDRARSYEAETESLTGDEFNHSEAAAGSERGGAKDDFSASRKEAGDLGAEVNTEVNSERRLNWEPVTQQQVPTADSAPFSTGQTTAPPSIPGRPLTFDLPAATSSCISANIPSLATPLAVSPAPDVGGAERGPRAVVGPDRKLFLPVSSLKLDGGESSGSRGVASFHWEALSGPPGLRLEGADQQVATASGLQQGRYTFRLTVSDRQGATDSTSLTVRVQEARSLPPVAHASGSHTLMLPNSSLLLRGSVTSGDQSHVHFLWVRDPQSPAAGDVLYGSEQQASLYLANLVQGTYLFQLRVTDGQGRLATATATVEVRPEPDGGEQVELELLVSVSELSVAQRDTVVRQLAALLHVVDSDIQVGALQGRSDLSTVMRLCVRGPSGPLAAPRLVALLRNQLLRERSDFLLFRVLRVDTVLCLLSCSGRGQCDPISKECTCDPFWTENVIRRYLGDGQSNCGCFVVVVAVCLSVRVEGALRHPGQLPVGRCHPVHRLDLHLLLQEEEAGPGEEEDQVHHPGRHGRAGESGAPPQSRPLPAGSAHRWC
ncbi:uncharacterized protein kiaa0319 isoform X2 [Nelusetta ayraudi]|uniref:uncharacterized protein kiaa0319 isoform X2 n=1 Tax=Nelusetta ayraudi TaxID=303726 RepID=UPI003F707CE1